MEQKVEKTNAELLNLIRNLNITDAAKGSKRESKLVKIAEKVRSLFEIYNEKREDIRLHHAYADENGVLILNEKGEYRFTKESIKAMSKDMKNLLDEKIAFDQFTFSTEDIEDLQFLTGWVNGIEAKIEQEITEK